MPRLAESFDFQRTVNSGAKLLVDGIEFPWHIDPEVSLTQLTDNDLPRLNVSIILNTTSVTSK